MKKSRVHLIIAICVAALVSACGAKQPEQISGVLTFIAGNANLNGKPAAVGAKIQRGDMIETRKKSCAVIQFFGSSLITLQENTSINVETLLERSDKNGGKNEIAVIQNKGTTFSKVIKNEASFSTGTKTTVAAVRGTAYTFTVREGSDNADVRLLHGKVDVLPHSGNDAVKPVSLTDGEKVISAGNGKKSAKQTLTASEKDRLSALDTIRILPVTKLAKGDFQPGEVVPANALTFLLAADESKHAVYKTCSVTEEQEKSARSLKTPSVVIAEGTQEPRQMTNTDLAKRYGKLSTVFTNDGKEYVGVFRQSGNTIELITTGGTVKVPTTEVRKVAPYTF